MGSSDSTCCGSQTGPPKPDIEDTGDTVKRLRSMKSYRDTVKPKCIYSQCEALQRIITVMNEYNTWLNRLRDMEDETGTTDYDKYEDDIHQLIVSIDHYSTELLLSDASHIKNEHYDQYTEVRQLCIDEMNDECSNHNCFSMRHYFLRNKAKERRDPAPLEMLTNLHIYMFHSIHVSQLKIQHVPPRSSYLIANYIENTQRILNIDPWPFPFKVRVVHLISFYYGAKLTDSEDALDTVSALQLAQFIENGMTEKAFDQIWCKLDPDASNTIDATEIDDILVLIECVVIQKARQESGKSVERIQIDTAALKLSVQPIATWMKRDKMSKQPEIKKDEFKETFSEWLREYQNMQKQVLKKYKMDHEEEEDMDGTQSYDRLVVNCEYLEEHQPVPLSVDVSSNGNALNPDAKSWKPDT